MIASAKQMHAVLDNWVPPSGIEVIQIAGWGIETVRGIKYSCGLFTCSSLSTLDRDILKTGEGDGTVVLPSAVAMTTAANIGVYYLNLREHNHEGLFNQRRNRDHASILEVEPLQEFLRDTLLNVDGQIRHISTVAPPVENIEAFSYVIHSPVDIHLYDEHGNHTGPIPNPLSDSDLRAYEANVPNSYYWEYGETKYAGSDLLIPTTVQLTGTASGTFTFEIIETRGDGVVATTTFKDVPVDIGSIATLEVGTTATTTPTLSMDFDGDGAADSIILPEETLTAEELLEVMRETVRMYNLAPKQEKDLINFINRVEKALGKTYKNEKIRKNSLEKEFGTLERKVADSKKKKILSLSQYEELVGVIAKARATL